jgi:hypothetical protein
VSDFDPLRKGARARSGSRAPRSPSHVRPATFADLPEMTTSPRLAARLFSLSHAQLLEIAVAGCEASPEVKNRAEAILATSMPRHHQGAVDGVLLSSDLVPHILASLQLEDGAAAAVCSLWAEGWKATSEGRRHLTRVAFDFPQELLVDLNDMAVIPGDDEQLVVSSGRTVRILDRSMSTVTSFTGDERLTTITTDEQSIYATAFSAFHLRLTHNGTEVACHEDPDGYSGYCPLRAPGGLLFCVHYEEPDAYAQDDISYEQDEIVAFDAHSMQPRYRFGKSLLNDARGLAVVGEELFVCDMKNDRLQVFSLAGEHRRSITGKWKRPSSLCVVKDRLYLTETCDFEEDEPLEDLRSRGRRIFVLSLQGDTLQVYPIPAEGIGLSGSLVYFDGKLLVPYTDYRCAHVGMLALRGA